MSDQRLRDLERRFKETGSPDDEAAWLLERVRVGDLSRERLELAGYCGHEGARRATGHAPPPPKAARPWIAGVFARGFVSVAEVALATARLMLPIWESRPRPFPQSDLDPTLRVRVDSLVALNDNAPTCEAMAGLARQVAVGWDLPLSDWCGLDPASFAGDAINAAIRCLTTDAERGTLALDDCLRAASLALDGDPPPDEVDRALLGELGRTMMGNRGSP